MTNQPAVAPTSEERTLGAVAHFFGFVVALIIWATQKDKSRFLRFQAIQAVAFDAAAFVIVFLLIGCLLLAILLFGFGGVALSGSPDQSAGLSFGNMMQALAIIVPILADCIIFAFVIGLLVMRVVAAIQVYQGRNYHHPILGDRLEKMLGQP